MRCLYVAGSLGVVIASCSERPAEEAVSPQILRGVSDLPSGHVAWQPWSERDSARLSGRPILLFLYTRRSYWCREIIRHCFSDPEVAREIRHSTIPVRVDVDRRPDLAERYGMGAWPSVVFLSPETEWITGSTFLDSDDLVRLVRRIRVFFDHPDRLEDLDRARCLLEERSARRFWDRDRSAVEPTFDVMLQMADSIRAVSVRGEDPGPEALRLLLSLGESEGYAALRRDAILALDRIISGRLKDSDGGFFLAELTPDGVLVDREKHLLRNAGLLSVLAAVSEQTEEARFLEAARGLADFLLDGFYDATESQFVAGYAGFYEHGVPEQSSVVTRLLGEQTPPIPDLSYFTGWNAGTVSALLEFYPLDEGNRLLEVCREVMSRIRVRAELPGGGLRHTDHGLAEGPLFLEDHALAARAWLDLYDIEARPSDLQTARDLVDFMLEDFGHSSGALYDRSPEPGRPHFSVFDRLMPSGNGVAAQVLIRLYRLTGHSPYLESAEGILTALIGPNLDRAANMGALGRGLFDYLHASAIQKTESEPE